MNFIKNYLFIAVLCLSQICLSQTTNDLTLYRKDFKGVNAKNTVSVTSYQKNGTNYVYTGGAGNIDVFSVDKSGLLTAVSTHELYKKKGPGRGLVADNINGTDFLFVGNKYGNAVEVFKILDNGSLERVFLIEDTDETHLGTVITIEVVHMKKASYLFVGGLEDTPGLTCFKIHNDGKLTHVQSMKDDEKIHTDGVIGMFTHKIKGKTFLFTGGFQDNGISSFRVYENGTFKNINNIDDNTTDRYLTGAYPVTGVTFGDDHYVIVGHRHHKYYTNKSFIKRPDFVYHGDAVSVFKVSKRGKLVPHSILKDDENTKLSGQTRIEIVSANENEAIIAVGTRDDASIQLCKLNKNGILTPVNYLETGFSIYYGLEALNIDNKNFLVAGSQQWGFQKMASYQVAPKKKEREGKVLKHLVNLKFKEGTPQEKIDHAIAVFEGLATKVPSVTHMEGGLNDSTEGHSKGFTHSYSITFKDDNAREIYLFHPEHLKLVNIVGPLLADVFVIDYWTE
ncbi:6-phosphogluconolactonase (cycloisomerase 2 family) [Wenyingzhuangia heitensis]|uniref:6-phosphogluconolactonase (Cycloisomerase 2 family) n=1 Tax=Wenyingzhuangia heitensis TaxID=1487859 RepID=A0ABX0UDG9_9FLAO|nr:Dabb family protein [Wenyingzhuangia heitensis]NIJ45211.1 6-phosphogluconolactonase (cycloisomerase 2 family) [Wenyingzhuangia heitensis]